MDILTESVPRHDYHKVIDVPIDAVRKISYTFLIENVFIYEEKVYQHILGGVMGPAFILTLANTSMWKWER